MQRNHPTRSAAHAGVPHSATGKPGAAASRVVEADAGADAGPEGTAEGAPRKRLAPELRVRLILDAALQQFAARGYEATRMDDIAHGAGLSKGGLYAHFAGKDEIFQALLDRSLPPIVVDQQALAACASVRELIRTLIDPFYASLSDPQALKTLRLLATESARVPEIAARWRAGFVDDHLTGFREALEPWVAAGAVRPTILLDAPWLAIAPALHPLVGLLVSGASPDSDDLRRVRSAHEQLLCELLEPANSKPPHAGSTAGRSNPKK